jgi:hypothetical protein
MLLACWCNQNEPGQRQAIFRKSNDGGTAMGEHIKGTLNVTITTVNTNATSTIYIHITGNTSQANRQTFIQGIKDLAQQAGMAVTEVTL